MLTRPDKSIVSIQWLKEHLSEPDLIILDASLPKPKSNPEDNPLAGIRIAGARFFDIDHRFSDTSSSLPHMMPSAKHFNEEAGKLGINKSSFIVVYDNLGVYSGPRAWWMFRAMGHENVFVLDGGLPQWVAEGLPTEEITPGSYQPGDFNGSLKEGYFRTAEEVLHSIDEPDKLVLDARSAGRFEGTAPEPRQGLRGGHIPGSANLPFPDVVNDKVMKNVEELSILFDQLDAADKELIFSCGSGLTACIIGLAADLAGHKKLSVYDGSWSEWGQPSELPVVTK